ncbi:hypothetical protein [Thermobaculum terrenum]|nr:hypothetical protein [Thermobaculum terrenum]
MRRRRLIEATEDWGTDLEGLDTGSLRTCEEVEGMWCVVNPCQV